MVDRYMEELIDMFVKEYTPAQICKELRLCQDQVFQPATLNEIPPLEDDSEEEADLGGGPFCVICEFAMTMVEKQVLNNRTLDMVERAVQMVCAYMPETVADRCHDFVDEYGDKIIQIIVDEEVSPKAVCSALTLCTERMEPTLVTPTTTPVPRKLSKAKGESKKLSILCMFP